MTRRRPEPKRYTPAQKRRILAAAQREDLTGAEVQRRFGVSPLTFYRWRGPVGRGRRAGGGGRAEPAHHGLLETAEIDVLALREEVRRALQHVLPRVVEEEIEAYLAALLRSA